MITVFTDIDKAGKIGIENSITAGAKTMIALMPYELEAMKEVVAEKFQLFDATTLSADHLNNRAVKMW